MKIIHIVGARPNFMKIAPIMAVINNYPLEIEQVLVHTGQHYDTNLSAIFFDDLDLPQPDHHLGIGSGTHAIQTARIMLAFEPLIQELAPDLVLIVGDVNSTLACALVCAKLNIPVGHVEAGLRSFDRTMSEEINRLLTDQISDLLFIPSPDGRVNLLREGIVEDRIIYVGNIMIDTLVNSLPLAVQRWSQLQSKYQLDRYVLFTLHRPSNADEEKRLQQIIEILGELSQSITVLFPVHPRTR
ncbi:UDP-N-acetylglucosamine 2-epimerase (non-hydrolyzing), partial [Candidatus Pacearchaeota archaeon]|nr:UDP-N-acetylglucosamine 2-epimerase (non-hydrolyzing) [Candidatus Pacearchaeota archaeon]